MRYWKTIQAHCPSCHGRGELFVDEIRDGEYWVSSVECHCVEHHHDDEMKAFLARVTTPTPADGCIPPEQLAETAQRAKQAAENVAKAARVNAESKRVPMVPRPSGIDLEPPGGEGAAE